MVIKSSSVMLSPITYLIIGISLIFVQVNSSARTNVIIRGTTTAPNFTRQEEAMKCPVDYPWAFDFGLKCCKTYKGAILNQDLEYNDPITACENANWIPCPSLETLCRSRVEPVSCPASHPLGLIEAGCCQSIVSVYDPDADPPCYGDILNHTSPSSCCTNFSQKVECMERRQKCLCSEGDLVKDPPSILEDTPYSNSFPAQYALTDSQCDKHGKNYWLSGSGGRYFIIDMAYHFIPNQIVLRNAHNGGYNDRGTREFKIYGSDTKPPIKQQNWPAWIEIVQGSFPRPSSFGSQSCRIPLTMLSINNTRRLRYFKFEVLTVYGYGGALQFIGIY